MDWIEAVTTAVAVAALVLSIVNFRLTGSAVRVKVSQRLRLFSGGQVGRGNYVAVIAYNIGRTEVEVENVGFLYRRGERKRWLIMNPAPGSNLGPPLPFTLRPGHSGSWTLDADQIQKDVPAHQKMRAFVELGNDKVRRSWKRYRPPDLLKD